MTTTDGHTSAHTTAGAVDPDVTAESPEPARATAWVLLVGGLVGASAALVLLLDKIAMLVDPSYVPSCNLDPLLSCGSIMKTAQSEVLGFPNPILGLLTFPVVAAMGAFLVGRVALPAWAWVALQIGALTGLAFVGWLITQSVAVIGKLCPWCMLVWTVTIAVFWFVTAHNLDAGRLEAGPPGRVVARHPAVATALTLVVVLGVLIAAFPTWFGALISG